MDYYIIGDEDTILGFRMAGVNGREANTKAEAEAAFTEAISKSNIGILIITERTADLIRVQVDKYLFSMQFPLIVEIPDRKGKVPGKPNIREIVNQAIGIKL